MKDVIRKINEPHKCANTCTALTKSEPVSEVRSMAVAILLRTLREVKPEIDVCGIPGLPNHAADSEGNVWRCCKSGEWVKLKPHKDRDGYLRSVINGKEHGIHALVLTAFAGPRPDGMDACHYPDQCKTNNVPSNLRWASRRTNMSHKLENGTYQGGEQNNGAKLTESMVVVIRERAAQGELASNLSTEFGVSTHQIRRIVQRRIWQCVSPRPFEAENIRTRIAKLSKDLAKAQKELESIECSSPPLVL